jgi:tetratricopeptide (TPR) repeat protein
MLLPPDSSACAEHLERARNAAKKSAYSVAVREFTAAANVCPNREQILLSVGQMQFLSGDTPAAERTLRQLGTPQARYALGRIYYEQFRYPEAVEQLKAVIAAEPDNYRAHDNLGLCYDALQQDSDALRHFLRALDLVKDKHPDYDWAYANLAEFFLKRDQADRAFQLAAEAAQRNASSARNFYLAGRSLVKLGRDENSLRWLERAVELDPTHVEAQFQLGHALRRLGKIDEAKRHLEAFRRLKAREASKPDRPSRP